MEQCMQWGAQLVAIAAAVHWAYISVRFQNLCVVEGPYDICLFNSSTPSLPTPIFPRLSVDECLRTNGIAQLTPNLAYHVEQIAWAISTRPFVLEDMLAGFPFTSSGSGNASSDQPRDQLYQLLHRAPAWWMDGRLEAQRSHIDEMRMYIHQALDLAEQCSALNPTGHRYVWLALVLGCYRRPGSYALLRKVEQFFQVQGDFCLSSPTDSASASFEQELLEIKRTAGQELDTSLQRTGDLAVQAADSYIRGQGQALTPLTFVSGTRTRVRWADTSMASDDGRGKNFTVRTPALVGGRDPLNESVHVEFDILAEGYAQNSIVMLMVDVISSVGSAKQRVCVAMGAFEAKHRPRLGASWQQALRSRNESSGRRADGDSKSALPILRAIAAMLDDLPPPFQPLDDGDDERASVAPATAYATKDSWPKTAVERFLKHAAMADVCQACAEQTEYTPGEDATNDTTILACLAQQAGGLASPPFQWVPQELDVSRRGFLEAAFLFRPWRSPDGWIAFVSTFRRQYLHRLEALVQRHTLVQRAAWEDWSSSASPNWLTTYNARAESPGLFLDLGRWTPIREIPFCRAIRSQLSVGGSHAALV